MKLGNLEFKVEDITRLQIALGITLSEARTREIVFAINCLLNKRLEGAPEVFKHGLDYQWWCVNCINKTHVHGDEWPTHRARLVCIEEEER